MRLLRKDLRKAYLFSKSKSDRKSVYDTGIKYENIGCILCNVQPINNEIKAQAYGERIFNMLSLVCEKNQDIKECFAISFGNEEKPEYKVVSVMEYKNHNVVTVEKGVGLWAY